MKSQSSPLLAAAKFGLLGAAATAFGLNMAASPATNAAMRALGPHGDWRQASGAAFYDAGDYYFEMGFAHIVALASMEMSTREGRAASVEHGAALLGDARALLRDAVARSPADANAWGALALAAALSRDGEALETALKRSWRLSPHNAFLSGVRLLAVAIVAPESLDAEARAGLRRDLRLAEARQPGRLSALFEAAPTLARLAESLDES